MKKIILGILAVSALTACDPSLEKNEWSGETVSKEQLANGISIKQYGGDKSACNYTEIAGGNWVEFSTNPSKVVRVYYIKKDGSQMDLSKATANGIFYLKPSRGSDPNQTLYFETLEFDGSSVTAEKQLTFEVAQELTPEMVLACSNKGEKTWKWDTRDGGAFWGNMGYTPGNGDDFADNRSGQWWGVTSTSEFADQQQHRGSDTVTGDDDTDAYMVFSEDGSITCYDKNNKAIRQGSFEIANYSPDSKKVINDQAWSVGQLKTSAGSILWPYAINTNGYQPEEFEIVRLTPDQLILTYAAAGTGSWSEATYWRFYCDSDPEGCLTNASNGWTWDASDGGAFWGNMGYTAGSGDDFADNRSGQWWGVTSTAEFADQQQHRGTDKVTGDDDTNAYMMFSADGLITSYNAKGDAIRSGSWEIANWDATSKKVINDQAWSCGQLKTTAGSILWPYAINTSGYQPEEFEIVRCTPSQLILSYAAAGTGSWSEATYWRFIKK